MRRRFKISALLSVISLMSATVAYGAPDETRYITPAPDDGASIAITSWLVAGPLPSPHVEGESPDGALRVGYAFDFLEPLGGEANARIYPGTEIPLPDEKLVQFNFHQWEGPYTDLTDIFGRAAKVCAYLYAEIESAVDQTVYFHVGTNDAGKVWVGGNEIVAYPGDRGAARSEHAVPVALPAGRTPVLVKVDQAGGDWGAFVEVYGAAAHARYLAEEKTRDQAKDLDDPNGIATHIETKVICKQDGRYIGWPTIAKTQSGELVAVFSGDRDAHVCPYGVTQLIRSTDNGKTWNEPVIVNNTPLDDRDAGILQTRRGTLLVSWFTSLAFDTPQFYEAYPQWTRHAGKLGPETKERWLGNWTRRSEDYGATWADPVQQNVSAPHGPIELADGRLLYVGTGSKDDNKVIGIEESRDDGRSWQMIGTIPIPADESIDHYHEPHVAEVDGKLVAMIRYEPMDRADCHLRQSESYDGGKTWTTAHKTPIWGYPPHLTVLDNGWLMVAYGVRRRPYSERACVSRDGGKTWDVENEIILSRAMNGDLGYPASVQLDDGSILTIYYQIDKPGELTCLMSTHWRLNP
jgi:hypothetical protein